MAFDLLDRRHVPHEGGPVNAAGAAARRPPVEVAALAEELLRELRDDELRQITPLSLEGRTNAEIGVAIGKSVAAVERKLHRIRNIWAPEVA